MSTLTPRQPPSRPPAPGGAAGRGPAGPAGRRPASGPPGRLSGEAHRLHRLTVGFAQAFLEVECGRRTPAQLRPVLCPLLADRLAHIWVRPGPPGRVVTAYGLQVSADRYEAVAVVRRGQRFGALVVSLARSGRRWRVVDAARPEDAPVQRPTSCASPPMAQDPPTGEPPAQRLAPTPSAR